MDKETRNKLRNVVTQCRKLLEESVSQVLQGRFGIHADGKVEDAAGLKHLSDEEQHYREQAIVHLRHIAASGMKPKDAVAQLIREVAFTHLNRLAAFKLMESRKLIREAVSRGPKSNGYKFYLADHPDDYKLDTGGQQEVAYSHFLLWQAQQFSGEISALFSPNDLANRLFPPQRVLDQVLEFINADDIAYIWARSDGEDETGDETIGWIYQYFTPKELRDAARDPKRGGSAAPRNSHELAFRNQFFTARYVVRFLVDNTLGRIWYEMRKGQTALADTCKYLVRRKDESFLDEAQEAPPPQNTDGLSQEQLLALPVQIPHRSKKDPRKLKVLDPAVGSAHFLLYCFDLLQVIYEEAYTDAELGPALQTDYPTLDELKTAVPALILRHNLHGIDIDLRATQIAGLALWLRAQRAYQDLGIKGANRPPITRANIVCAEPMPGESDLLEEFTAALQPRVLGQLVEVVFDKMKLAGEAGSLLKIEEELRGAIAEAKRQWQAGTKQEQLILWEGIRRPRVEQMTLFDVKSVTDEAFWEDAEAKVFDALRQYAARAANGRGLSRRLFAEDAQRGFGFIDACRQRYDVVLMNPPFGEAPLGARGYLYSSIPETARDLVAGFISRGTELLCAHGILGAITNRTVFFSDFLEEWRSVVFGGGRAGLGVMADLGYGVLDAVVETAAYTCKRASTRECVFINLLGSTDKGRDLVSGVGSVKLGGKSDRRIFVRTLDDFRFMPDFRFAYHLHGFWMKLLNQTETHPLYQSKAGLTTGDDFRYLRCSWEIPLGPNRSKNWMWLAKGGEFSRYASTIHLMVDWDARDDLNRTRNDELYGKRGVTYTERTTSNLSCRVLNAESAFSGAGPGVIPYDERDCNFLLAYLNSAVASYCLEALIGGGDSSASGTAARHLEPGYLQRLPVVALADEQRSWFNELMLDVLRREVELLDDECHPLFSVPKIGGTCSLKEGATTKVQAYFAALGDMYPQLRDMDARVLELLHVPPNRAADLYEDTGYPLPTNCDLSSLPEGWKRIVMADGEDAAPARDDDESRTRLDTKLSSHLHSRLERLAHRFNVAPESMCAELAASPDLLPEVVASYVRDVLSLSVGFIFGRWNVRFAIEGQTDFVVADPFGPLPLRPPAMLQNCDGAPECETAADYPVRIDGDGVLVDDPDHTNDIVRRVREALAVIWPDRSEAIEQEAAEFLVVKDLREYFRRSGSGGFWLDHVRRYSKSRRKAPIYWLLQSSRRNYAIWLYYHRLDKDILFKALLNYAEPKVRLEEDRLKTLLNQKVAAGAAGRAARQLEKDIDKWEALVSELREFRDKLKRVADLHLIPDLNDGVVLNIAPLHELVPWREAKDYWDELLAGKYEWSSIGKQLREKGMVK